MGQSETANYHEFVWKNLLAFLDSKKITSLRFSETLGHILLTNALSKADKAQMLRDSALGSGVLRLGCRVWLSRSDLGDRLTAWAWGVSCSLIAFAEQTVNAVFAFCPFS